MNILMILFYVFSLASWMMVTYAVVTWRVDEQDDDGGIPPEDEPTGPDIDWGAWPTLDDEHSVPELVR